jgi:ABC-type antimicrobial peptide transport system permease subunit
MGISKSFANFESSDEDLKEMNEKTKETVNAVAKIAFPTLGALTLLVVVVAGGALCLASLFGMMVFYEPAFFGFTFAIGFLVAILGTLLLSRKLFELNEGR